MPIQIIDKESDANWFKAELDGKEGFVPSNYIQFQPHEYDIYAQQFS